MDGFERHTIYLYLYLYIAISYGCCLCVFAIQVNRARHFFLCVRNMEKGLCIFESILKSSTPTESLRKIADKETKRYFQETSKGKKAERIFGRKIRNEVFEFVSH